MPCSINIPSRPALLYLKREMEEEWMAEVGGPGSVEVRIDVKFKRRIKINTKQTILSFPYTFFTNFSFKTGFLNLSC